MNPLTQIERALQSSNLSDHLSAIAQCSKAIRENPFPLFVNALLLRLADTFNGEKLTKMDHSLNLIRLRIVKLLRECGMDLAVVFSKDEIVRRVMKVSHSNDYKSRALTMLFFAAAAPIVHSNKKVHHLLVEGADCTDLTELTAAIVSVGHLGKFSAEFSSLIVEKIGEMVSETQTEESLKVRLMDDLSLFQENVMVTKQCMELGRSLLRNNPDQKVSLVVLNALTELAKRNGLALNEQIDLLLTEMPQFLKSRHFTRSFLSNLARLADYPQHWTTNQVQMLQRILPFLIDSEFPENLVLWLDCMNVLAQRIHSTAISDSIPALMELLNNSKFIIRIRTLQLLLTLAGKTSLPAEKLATVEEIKPLLGSEIINLMEEISESPRITRKMEKVRFFKSIVKLMRNGTCSSYGLDEMSIIEVLQRAVESRHPEYYRQTLETLNAIADAIPATATELSEWALERLGATQEGQFHTQSDLLYNLALLPIKENQEKILELTEKIVNEVRSNEEHTWFAYKFARTGFRYGHWSEVALPTLELMQEKCQTVESSAFISALINIAGAQLPSKIDVQSLKNARQTLRHALLLLTPLAKNSRNTHCFTFPAAYIDAVYRLFGATNTVLVAMNTLLESNPETFGIAHIEYVLPDIEQAREEFIEVREAWVQLYQRSFDADSNTLNQLELMNRHAQLCELLLDRLYSQELTPIAQFPRCAENCTNAQLEHLLDWAITKANQCFVPVTGSISQRLSAWASNLQVFDEIFGRLAIPSLCLPRFFFQQLWRTNIRVNILPQPREHEQYLQLTSRQFPLTVEGIIESNNPKGIQSMEIYVYMKVDKNSEEVLADKRKTNLNAETYFKEQFLLTIRKMTEITVKLYFTDANSDLKKLWRAESEGRLVVNIPEFKDTT